MAEFCSYDIIMAFFLGHKLQWACNDKVMKNSWKKSQWAKTYLLEFGSRKIFRNLKNENREKNSKLINQKSLNLGEKNWKTHAPSPQRLAKSD